MSRSASGSIKDQEIKLSKAVQPSSEDSVGPNLGGLQVLHVDIVGLYVEMMRAEYPVEFL